VKKKYYQKQAAGRKQENINDYNIVSIFNKSGNTIRQGKEEQQCNDEKPDLFSQEYFFIVSRIYDDPCGPNIDVPYESHLHHRFTAPIRLNLIEPNETKVKKLIDKKLYKPKGNIRKKCRLNAS